MVAGDDGSNARDEVVIVLDALDLSGKKRVGLGAGAREPMRESTRAVPKRDCCAEDQRLYPGGLRARSFRRRPWHKGEPVPRYCVIAGSSHVEVAVRTSVGTIAMAADEIAGELDADVGARGVYLAVTRPTCRIEVPVRALHSGNRMLDHEGRRRFEANRYPLVVAELVGAIPCADGEHRVTWRLTVHGRTHDIDGSMSVETVTDDVIHVQGSESFDLRDWGMEPGSYLGLKVHPDAKFTVDLLAAADAASR
ncbi:MAG: YceI family protein [Acidimicrobiia bacterium]